MNSRKFCPQISFGTLNDGNGLNRFDYTEDEWMDSQMQMTDLPYENDTKAIKAVVWNALSRIYRGQMALWQKTKKKSTQTPLAATQSAVKTLLRMDLVTRKEGYYSISDPLMDLWLKHSVLNQKL